MGVAIKVGAGERTVCGYRAAPVIGGPGVLVLHAWWGMTDTFKRVCDRLASEGYVALVPDLYGGKTANTIEEAEELLKGLDHDQAMQDVAAAARSLIEDPQVRGKSIGGIGFSMGAAYVMWLATCEPALRAAVVFYGGSEQDAGFAEQTRAAILGHFAENDEWEPHVDETIRLQNDLRRGGLDVTFHIYPGTGHWFFEENRSDAYNAEAAQLAWQRTIEFLHDRL
jgi:carboxymethylenebutenolidase